MSVQIGSKAVGSIVKLRENGALRNYIIVHQGIPSYTYDPSCNGTWLLRQDCINRQSWGSTSTSILYSQSLIHRWLNDTMFQQIDASIRDMIKQVKLPCLRIRQDFENLPCKVFLLADVEVGWHTGYAEHYRARLEYFYEGNNPTANDRRIATYGSSPAFWWLRTPEHFVESNNTVMYVGTTGHSGDSVATSTYAVRPAFVVPPTLMVSDDGIITTNSPPTTPSSINLPSTVQGGASCPVSWSAASDPDGNLEGYIVERSFNGGSSWAQIYQGSATSTTTTIPHGTSTVMFRVCAYDTAGERSGWRTSSNKTVVNNRAPNTPPAINVPVTPSGGESVTVTWSAASDPDGNLEGYRLERQWDGKGSWAQIYQGAGLSFTETIPKGEHTSVAYRVRAYDSFGDTSGYTTSPVRTISNNTAPVIQCELSGDLGDKSEGFTIPYTVTDAENQAVTVTEKVGGMVKRTYQVTLGQSNTFQITGTFFQKVLNGKQTAEVIATDAEGKSSTLSLTFVKKVHRAVIMLTEPLAVDKEITVCVIKVLGDIPEDAEFKVEVANNAGDDSPAWEDATDAAKRGINHVFKNKTQTNGWKFGFRVTAARGASDTAGNIVSIQGGFQ